MVPLLALLDLRGEGLQDLQQEALELLAQPVVGLEDLLDGADDRRLLLLAGLKLLDDILRLEVSGDRLGGRPTQLNTYSTM